MKKSFSLLAILIIFLASDPVFPHLKILPHEEEMRMTPLNSSHFFLEETNGEESGLHTNPRDFFDLPCVGFITSYFGWRKVSKGKTRLHQGIDIAAPLGTPVRAPAQARVSFIGRRGGYGLTVILDHGNSLTTLYGHNSAIFVKEGDSVEKGQWIARIGTSGRSTGPHVHYEVRLGNKPIDPMNFNSTAQTSNQALFQLTTRILKRTGFPNPFTAHLKKNKVGGFNHLLI